MTTKNYDEILKKIRKDLKNSVDELTKATYHRYFKEPVKCYGIKTALVTAIAKKYWKEIKTQKKESIFNLAEELLSSDYTEEAFIVSNWIPHLSKQFLPEDLITFEKWIDKYINNWAKCDSFCNHTVGDFLQMYPEQIPTLFEWAKSKNRWMKRASAVSLIVPAKRGKYLEEAFKIADILLEDQDDMVQKGYGWLLKEESRLHQKHIFDYVSKNKAKMPRTALRYAIELMPETLRKEAMGK